MIRAEPNRVDVHVHPTHFSPHGAEFARRNGIDYSAAGLLREMDVLGIRWGVFLAPRLAPTSGAGREEMKSVVRASRGRFLATTTIDPTRGEESIEREIRMWDTGETAPRAVKLYPGYQPFDVTDRRLAPVYAWADRHRTPVFVHQGDTSDPNGLLRYARPFLLDEVAVRWRSVRFVLCHLGNPWIEEAAEVAYKNRNVWADTSGLLNPFARLYSDQVRRMRIRLHHALLAAGGPEKLLYGSDWPISRLADAVGLVTGLDLPKEDQEKILGGNARELFRLPT